jgi:hypothetical protein
MMGFASLYPSCAFQHHVFPAPEIVDARDKPGHDAFSINPTLTRA